MTFEIAFDYNGTQYTADVTVQGKDFLVNLVTPAYYEAAPTIAFTLHDDKSMKYDNTLFEDKGFMPVMEAAIRNQIEVRNIEIADT
jgi:hypothetical protein